MWRSLGRGTWTSEEQRHLGALEPFFVHALTVHDAGETPLVESDRTGLIIADTGGKVVYFSGTGRQLLFLATHPRNGPDTVFAGVDILPPRLLRLCRDLGRVFADDPAAAAPSYHCRNVWGGFNFRAQWLDGIDAASGLIAVTVSHQEPLPIRLIRKVERLPLSRRRRRSAGMPGWAAFVESSGI